MGDLADGDVLFLHGLKQRGLGLGRRAVDFVREDDLRKDGALLEDELAATGVGIFLNDLGAGDVGRHQVGRELDAAEGEVHRVGQRFDEEGLGQTGNAFEQAVTTGGDGDEDLLNDGLLSDNASAESSFEFVVT